MSTMQATLEEFLRALRASEVRVSPAEAIDAHMALIEVGYGDREILKDALCVTLAKSEDEVSRFDECFDTFFARSQFMGEAPPAPPQPNEQGQGGGESDLPLAHQAATVGLVFLAVALPCIMPWALLGAAAARLLQDPSRLRAFNIAMAVLLVLSMLPVAFG